MAATRKSDGTDIAGAMLHGTSRGKRRRAALKGILHSPITALLLTALIGVVLPGKAGAGCGSPVVPTPSGMQQVWWQSDLGRPSPRQVSDSNGNGKVVGLWKVNFISEGNAGIPDGTLLDHGFAEWHGDGTEIMNSSKAPATGNFCMGVWEKTGRSSYQLNHFALAYDSSGDAIGPAQIQETIAVDNKAQTFSGTFTIDQFDPAGNSLAHVAGNITGTRVTVNTTIDQVL